MSAPLPRLGIFTLDTDLVVRTWDPWIAAITGVAPEQALDRPIASLMPDLEARGLLRVFRDTLERGTVEVLAPALHENLVACPPLDLPSRFDRMQQRVSIGPIRQDGRVTGVVVTIEDVTARVEHERSLMDSAASLSRALGDEQWSVRQRAVRQLAPHGQEIVDALIRTLRDQHHDFSVLSSALDLLAITDVDVIEPMIGCLASDDVDLRIQAALILGERRDARAIPALMRALDDPDTNVQFHAIEALGRLHASEAVDVLLGIAERQDFFLAFPAIQALVRVGGPSIAPRLVPLLADEFLRAPVAEALGELGDDVVAEPLVQLLAEPHAPADVIAEALSALYDRYESRYGAGDQIAIIARRSATPAATQNLLEAVQQVSSDRLRGLARVLGWLDGQAVQRALTRLLGQATVRAQVVEALVRYGSGVVDLLIEQLHAEDLETRQAAAVALGRIGDRRATAALVAALGDPEMAVPVAGALARIGDAAAFDALLALVGHPDTAIRQSTIAALNSIGHPEMPQRVLPLLQDANPLVRESAVRIAGYFGYPECATLVIERCSDESEPVRRASVEQLPLFEHPRAVGVLAHALADGTAPIRAAAAAAFARVGQHDAVEPLTHALSDRDPWVRYFAMRSLGSFRGPTVAQAALDRLAQDPAAQVRLVAIEVLGRLQPPETLPILEPLSRSDDPDIARAAIRALGFLQDARAQPALEALLRAEEPWRRVEALGALGQRGGPQAISALEWAAAADVQDDVAQSAIGGLARLASRDDENGAPATRALLALTAEPSKRPSSIAALAGLPTARIPDVAAGLRHGAPPVRRATVEALSRMRHTDATLCLETALDDAVPMVRAAAVAELRRLGCRTAMRKLVMLARTDPDVEVRHAAMMASADRSGGHLGHPPGSE